MGAAASKLERLARLFTTIVVGDWQGLRDVRLSAPSGEPDRGWREALLQAHVFAGFPRVVEALDVLEDVGGLGALEPGEALAEDEQPARGRELFERIYAEHAPRVRAFLERGHPDFARWIEGHAYGRILSRPGLSAAERELLAVCALAALGQERQLVSHVRGALRCGAEPHDVRQVLNATRAHIGVERCDAALRIAERVASREARERSV